MAKLCERTSHCLRPHFKAHKISEIAALQLQYGATGISVATLNEAWDLTESGMRCPILITSEQVGAEKLNVLKELFAIGIDLWLCIETTSILQELDSITSGRKLNVLVDVDIGDHRTGASPEHVVEIVGELSKRRNLLFRGIQAYQGHPSSMVQAHERREAVFSGWEKARGVIHQLTKAGFPPEIVSGGNTSTIEFDIEAGVANEFQLGGYAVGDLAYASLERPREICLPNGEKIINTIFNLKQALRVVSSVVSLRSSDEVMVDAGLKAFSTDKPFAPKADLAVKADYVFEGDEFGRLTFSGPHPSFTIGERISFFPQHCDPTINLYNSVEIFTGRKKWMGTWKVIGKHPFSPLRGSADHNRIQTKCLHSGYSPANSMNSRQVPIYPTVGYTLRDWQHASNLLSLEEEGFTYSRIHNPTVSVFEQRMAELEGGGSAVGVASGAAAVSMALLSLCRAGDNFISTTSLYGGTYDLMKNTLGGFNINGRLIDLHNLSTEIEKLIDERSRAIFIEAIGNPRLDIPDFNFLSSIARRYKIPLLIDNTVATPSLLKVRDVGGDVAIYSASKFLGGHGAAMGGVVIDLGTFDWENSNNPIFTEQDPSYGFAFGAKFKSRALAARVRACLLRNLGPTLGPFNAWCVIQGLETLRLRMDLHSANALKVARFLSGHPLVEWVSYPGLPDHPSYHLCQKYMNGKASGMIFFGLKGGAQQAQHILTRFGLISHVTQFGDARSSIQHPATTSHQQIPNEKLVEFGVSDNMLRLSVGLENATEIISDLDQALDSVSTN